MVGKVLDRLFLLNKKVCARACASVLLESAALSWAGDDLDIYRGLSRVLHQSCDSLELAQLP